MRFKQIASTALKILIPIAIFLVILLKFDTLQHLDVGALVKAAPSVWAAYAVVLGVYALKAILFVIPASMIYLSVGAAFPTAVAVALNCVGIALEITISYLLGRFLGGDKVDKMLRGKKGYEKLEKFRSKGRFAFVFLLRFSSFPIDFGSLFFGASDFAFPSYFLMSLCGILPRVVVMTILGHGLFEFIEMKYILIGVLCAVPVVLIWFAVTAVRKKKQAAAAGAETQTGGDERSDPA
ncbi:MAG: VTT domain-containing protein [Clostridia bacterium]|nr:VTT domain-containing protein [Clostridia bacterium]